MLKRKNEEKLKREMFNKPKIHMYILLTQKLWPITCQTRPLVREDALWVTEGLNTKMDGLTNLQTDRQL
jgi:hypothetical protein